MALNRQLLKDLEEAARAKGLQPVINAKRAAGFARVNASTITRWIALGRFPATRKGSGKMILIPRDAFLRWLAGGKA